MEQLKKRLQDKKDQGLYRVPSIASNRTGVRRIINQREVISFCSNDYLGLASDPRIIQSFQEASARYGVGSGAAALINGRTDAHAELESYLARLTQRDRALLFSTGYMANLGVTSVLADRHTQIFEDRLNHASLIDGARLAQAKLKRYPHSDTGTLRQWLSNTPNALVMTDAIFSMHGDRAELADLSQLCHQHQALLVVDDAHGFGVFGDQGCGSLCQYGLSQDDVPVMVGTLGKACGTFGAFVAGSETLIETLIQEARTYLYTTAMPAAIAAATLTALNIIAQEPQHYLTLQDNIKQFKQLMHEKALPQTDSQTAIQPLVIGDPKKTLALSQHLLEQGIQITAIRPPTVAVGQSRLRITLSAAHQPQDIQQLVSRLEQHRDSIISRHE